MGRGAKTQSAISRGDLPPDEPRGPARTHFQGRRRPGALPGDLKRISPAYLNLLTLPPRCQFALDRTNYAPVKHDRVDDNDETIRLPESAPLHLVLAIVLVLVAHLVRLRVQRRQPAHAGVIERREFLDLSI